MLLLNVPNYVFMHVLLDKSFTLTVCRLGTSGQLKHLLSRMMLNVLTKGTLAINGWLSYVTIVTENSGILLTIAQTHDVMLVTGGNQFFLLSQVPLHSYLYFEESLQTSYMIV